MHCFAALGHLCKRNTNQSFNSWRKGDADVWCPSWQSGCTEEACKRRTLITWRHKQTPSLDLWGWIIEKSVRHACMSHISPWLTLPCWPVTLSMSIEEMCMNTLAPWVHQGLGALFAYIQPFSTRKTRCDEGFNWITQEMTYNLMAGGGFPQVNIAFLLSFSVWHLCSLWHL